ncbi:MAG: hypothetical protein ACK5PB_19835 [Pirellula sp.]|jgi:hypothetical protein
MTIRTSQLERESAIAKAEQWSRDLAAPFLLTENTSGAHSAEVRELLSRNPCLSDTVWEALIWLRAGSIQRAHELVQDASTGFQAYIHGMIHRLEGDYWNAKYWFRNAGRNTVGQIIERINVLETMVTFDPSLLVDRLEQFHRSCKLARPPQECSGNGEAMAIVRELEQEWWAVWNLCKP